MQVDDTAIKPMEGDITAILGNSRTNACVQQLLDLANDLRVFDVNRDGRIAFNEFYAPLAVETLGKNK